MTPQPPPAAAAAATLTAEVRGVRFVRSIRAVTQFDAVDGDECESGCLEAVANVEIMQRRTLR